MKGGGSLLCYDEEMSGHKPWSEIVHKKDALPKQLELEFPDPFLDDEPLECGLENPESCESCS